jgi:hypothetical protein
MGHRAPEKFPCIGRVFRYNPYNLDCCVQVEHTEYGIPEGTIHTALAGKVTFTPYPEQYSPSAPTLPKPALARIFIGQLPYQVTDIQLSWLCETFAEGVSVFYAEHIMKQDNTRNTKIPTGCVHAYCLHDDVATLIEGLHKRTLIDDTGVWHAEDAEELRALTEYCSAMKTDRKLRVHNRPYDTVVVQFATSTYVPPPPTYAAFVQTDHRVPQ